VQEKKMPVFKDANKREWIVKLDAPKIQSVRSRCNVNLTDFEGNAYGQMSDDPCLLVNVLWVLCENDAKEVTQTQFGEALVGNAIDDATAALLEAIKDFFPERKRDLLTAIAAQNQKFEEAGFLKAMAAINDPELERQVLEAMDQRVQTETKKILTQLSSATSWPVSAASPSAD